jgi:4-amino-4-deoxy-L-arabinose transferase-like glycosyltransferase
MPDTISSFLKQRWPLLVVLAVLICFKIPQLHYPFYIDEGMVYAPAVKMMALHGPSLMPGAIPSEFSRGHPMMFHFLCAIWIKCFGVSNTAIHSFALFVSVIFVIVLFEGCMRLFDRKIAILVLLLVATRVIFFVQSSFVYPEEMVAMFAFLSLYFYSRDRLVLTSAMLFLLFFTKEGGMIFGTVTGIDAFIFLFRKDESLKRRMQRLASVIIPTCLIALFFVIQHAKEGWYVLPEHTGLIKDNWNEYYVMFKSALYWAYRGDKAMYMLVFFIILLSMLPAIKFKNAGYLFLILPAIAIYSQAEMFPTQANGSVFWTILYLLFFTVPVYALLKLNKTLTVPQRKFIVLMSIGVLAFLYYSSLTLIAYRYLWVVIMFVLIFLAVCISMFIATGGPKLYYVAVAGILLIGFYGFYTNDRTEDTQLGAFRVMNVQLHGVAYLEKENAYDQQIAYESNWAKLHYTDTMEGYLSSGRVFTRIGHFPWGPSTPYALFDHHGDEADYALMLHNPDYHIVYKIADGDTWTVIFKHN